MYLIHVEKIWDNKVWANLLNFLEENDSNCYLFLMPPDYIYQQSVLGFRGTEKELTRILKQRYLQLSKLKTRLYIKYVDDYTQDLDFEVGLHLHTTLFPEELTKIEKTKMLTNGIGFLNSIFGDINGIAFGWFKYDKYLENLTSKYNLEIFHKGVSLHDYDLPLTKTKLLECWTRNILRSVKNKL